MPCQKEKFFIFYLMIFTGWHMKWSSIWFNINYSTMQWTIFCNMLTLNSRSWRLVLTVSECSSILLFLHMRQFTQDGWQRKIVCRTAHENSVVLYWNEVLWLHRGGFMSIFKCDGQLHSKEFINLITSLIMIVQCWRGNITGLYLSILWRTLTLSE
jgi:hypothetical protein